jgi:AhpD family alkylhydroperoxidase
MAGLLSRAARRPTQAQIRFVRPVPPGRAPAPVARVYAQVETEFGVLAPPISLHSPAPEPLAAAWLMLRESLVATGLVPRAVKEAVAVAVSLANACPYCVDVHSTALHGLVRSPDAVLVAAGQAGAVSDPELRRAAGWAASPFAVPPFPARQVPELVGTAVTFHYLNRMSNVFLVETPIPPRIRAPARRLIRRVVGTLLRPVLTRPAEPGGSLDLLPAAPLPADLSWAAGRRTVAAAFARAAAALDTAGRRSVPAPVRELVTAVLRDPDRGPAGPSRAWLRDAVAGLPAEDRPVARLALLTALASHQVTGSDIEELRHLRPDDRSLIEIAAWASLAAARRIGAGACVGT